MGETSPWSWVLISEITEMAELTSSMAKIAGWTSRIGWKVGWLIPLLMNWMSRVTYHIWFYRLVGFLSFSLDLYGFDLIPTMWWYILWETMVQFGFIWMTSWPLGWERDTFPASQLWWCLRACAGRTTGNNKDDRLGLTTAQVTAQVVDACVGILIQSRTIKIYIWVIVSIWQYMYDLIS